MDMRARELRALALTACGQPLRPASSGVEGTACPELVLSSFVLNVNHTLAVPNKKEHTSSAGISHTPVVLLPMLRACMWDRRLRGRQAKAIEAALRRQRSEPNPVAGKFSRVGER